MRDGAASAPKQRCAFSPQISLPLKLAPVPPNDADPCDRLQLAVQSALMSTMGDP